MISKLLLFVGLVAVSDLAFAEGNCPDGMVPIGGGGVTGCMPIGGDQSTSSTQSRGRWQTRWGAIAIGSTASGGGVGVATDMLSKRQAEKTAMAQCKATGGGAECKINLRYYNQCAVIAWGDTSGMVQGAETIKIASELALQKCSVRTKNCKILYTDCSLPAWVK